MYDKNNRKVEIISKQSYENEMQKQERNLDGSI